MSTTLDKRQVDLEALHEQRLHTLRLANVQLGKLKLGKLPVRHDPRTLQLASYLHPRSVVPEKLPLAPLKKNWTGTIGTHAWGMMGNDSIGDCTCAAAGHLIMEWTLNATSKEVILPDTAIVEAYSTITGYNPVTGSDDKGANELDVLNYWRKTGIGQHKITAYVALELGNHEHIKTAVYVFGGCYIGLNMPITAQRQRVWSVLAAGLTGDGTPGSWGGHAVPVIAYDPFGLLVVTWGVIQRMTWGFWDAYCDEAYAILSPDFMNKDGLAASGFDMQALQQDLQDLQ